MYSSSNPLPVVRTAIDIDRLAGQMVYVDGVYEQEDVRMMQVNPSTLFAGHVVVVLEDGCRVFIHPPDYPDARRSKQEIEQLDHRYVRAMGVILPRIPQEGAVQRAPCLIEVQSITLAAGP